MFIVSHTLRATEIDFASKTKILDLNIRLPTSTELDKHKLLIEEFKFNSVQIPKQNCKMEIIIWCIVPFYRLFSVSIVELALDLLKSQSGTSNDPKFSLIQETRIK